MPRLQWPRASGTVGVHDEVRTRARFCQRMSGVTTPSDYQVRARVEAADAPGAPESAAPHTPQAGAPETGAPQTGAPQTGAESHNFAHDSTVAQIASAVAETTSSDAWITVADAPRIAVYHEPHAAPQVFTVDEPSRNDDYLLPALARSLASRAYQFAKELGGQLPLLVFDELIDNLVHASFAGVVVTILDGGNTLRISDAGPGIPDKEAALRPGFTSADAGARRLIRGVGSGFSLVSEVLAKMEGHLMIEDNLGKGTVVTARVKPQQHEPLAPAPVPTYNLPERQLKTLLLAVELAPVGPTRVARELGVSTSTAYRDLVMLAQAGFVTSAEAGHRSVTEAGLAYLDAVLQTAVPSS